MTSVRAGHATGPDAATHGGGGVGTGLVYSSVTDRLAMASKASMRWRLMFSGIWLLYLIQPASQLFQQHRGALWIGGALALIVAFAAVYIVVIATWVGRPSLALSGLPILFAMAMLACLVFGGSGWNALWIYVSAATGLAIPDRRLAMRAVFGSGACFVLLSWLGHDSATDFLIALMPVILVGLATSGIRVQSVLTRELAQAREEVERLAASEERLRLARDMHDLTGQSLSMITLKSELAGKILGRLPDSPDRDQARDQIEEVAAVSRQTLHDIREAVSGYRRPTLAVETITARTALEAAGIEIRDDPRLITMSGAMDPEAEAALAWCLREAVTNVIRHSGARRCEIVLVVRHRELTLTVTDDGRGAEKTGSGSGLHGMSERLTAVGGHLSLVTAVPGFRLAATVPASGVP